MMLNYEFFHVTRMWTTLFWLLAMVSKMVSPTGSSRTHGAQTGVMRVTSRWKWARTCAVSIPYISSLQKNKKRSCVSGYGALALVTRYWLGLSTMQVLLRVHPTLLSHEAPTKCYSLFGINNACLTWAWWWVIQSGNSVVNRKSWREGISSCLYVSPVYGCVGRLSVGVPNYSYVCMAFYLWNKIPINHDGAAWDILS